MLVNVATEIMHPGSEGTLQEWTAVRSKFTQLYYIENRPLWEVMQMLKDEDEFVARSGPVATCQTSFMILMRTVKALSKGRLQLGDCRRASTKL